MRFSLGESRRLDESISAANSFQKTLQSIQNRTATVGVIGLGYVGLPLVRIFAAAIRLSVLIATRKKCECLSEARATLNISRRRKSPNSSKVRNFTRRAMSSDSPRPCHYHLRATPLSRIGSRTYPTSRNVSGHPTKPPAGELAVLESTTYPGTTREVCKPILEAGE